MYPFTSGRSPRDAETKLDHLQAAFEVLAPAVVHQVRMRELPAQIEAQPPLDERQIEPAAIVRVDLIHSIEQTQHAVRVDLTAEQLPEPPLRLPHDRTPTTVRSEYRPAPRRLDIEIPITLDRHSSRGLLALRGDRIPVCSSQNSFLSHSRQWEPRQMPSNCSMISPIIAGSVVTMPDFEVAPVRALGPDARPGEIGAAGVGEFAVHDGALEVDPRAEHPLQPLREVPIAVEIPAKRRPRLLRVEQANLHVPLRQVRQNLQKAGPSCPACGRAGP